MRRDRRLDILGNDPLLTPDEVARIFGVEQKTVRRWVKSGRLEALKTPGGQNRFRKSEIEWQLTGSVSES